MRTPPTRYPESIIQKAALEWLTDRHKDESFLIDLCLFHDRRISLKHYIRRNVSQDLWRTIPWWPNLAIRPDIVGLVKMPDSYMHGWIVAECKSRTLRPQDIRQAHFYAESSDAYAAYMFWDIEAGFTKEGFESLTCSGRPYTGIDCSGQKVRKLIDYVMYDNEKRDLFDDLEESFIIRTGRLSKKA